MLLVGNSVVGTAGRISGPPVHVMLYLFAPFVGALIGIEVVCAFGLAHTGAIAFVCAVMVGKGFTVTVTGTMDALVQPPTEELRV